MRASSVLGVIILLACSPDKETPSILDSTVQDTVVDMWDVSMDSGADVPWDGSDTVPSCDDYVDGDGDTIADHQEGGWDADSDGIPNSADVDSDNDGLADSSEAGDADLCTGPRDTDSDTSPDFLDPDSDNDGVSDNDELLDATDPYDSDSDDDGVSDLVEVVYGSDPLDPTDRPQSHGDFVFIVDYLDEPVPPRDTLVFGTDLQMADVYFVIDTSGSMIDEILNLQTSLQTTIVPGILAAIPDVQMGVMRFEDCPNASCANNLVNLRSITGDVTAVQSALDTITEASLCGGEEPYALSLYISASADVSGTPLPVSSCAAGYIGYPCFRPGAIPVVIQIGDEPFCLSLMGIPTGGCICAPRKSVAEAWGALNTIHAKYIGVNSSGVPGTMGPRPNMEEVALHTGSHDGSSLFVFDVGATGAGLDTQIVDAVGTLAGSVPLDISTTVRDVVDWPGETVDASLFVERVEPNTIGGVADPLDPTRVCVGGLPVGDMDLDGYVDYFDGVAPGTIVCFDIVAAMNTTVPRISGEPQLFTASVQVLGDTITLLDERRIYFLIPPDVHIEIPE